MKHSSTTSATSPSLNEVIKRSVIICYRENVNQLERTLTAERLNPLVVRATYSHGEEGYSNVYKCFMGHRNAWKRAAEADGYTLICEADFVPCTGLGKLPVFWPLYRSLSWGYLYQGSPRLLWLTRDGHLRGHAAPTVAYVVNSAVAQIFLEFFEYEMARYKPHDYFSFEAHLQWWSMGKGTEAYIPLRHYGEHGGTPQYEHRRARLNRSGAHRADNLQAPLAFLPQYAAGGHFRYVFQRLIGRTLGWGRLLTGKWIIDTNVYPRNFGDSVRMYTVGVHRLLPQWKSSRSFSKVTRS